MIPPRRETGMQGEKQVPVLREEVFSEGVLKNTIFYYCD
jgi:hypothetical protein